MDQKVERLFQGKNLVFIATINLDGSPQLTPVWGDYQNGYILVNTAEGRIKHRNVLHDSRVAVCVVAHDNPLDMTTIRGKVIDIIPDYEYSHAKFAFGDGIYSSTFFMATGFHGFHVLVGTIFLIIILFRTMAGHFKPEQHFGFEAAAWYWHFVDVVWLFLFFSIYWWGG